MRKAILLIVFGCLAITCPAQAQGDDAPERPRYAGRPQTTAQRQADQAFVAQAVEQHKTRAAAAENYVDEGWGAFYQEKFGQALQHYNRAWLLDSANADVYYGLSAYLSKRGTPAEARRYFQLGQQRDVRNRGALKYYTRMADLQEKLGDQAGVIASAQQALKLEPKEASAYRRLGAAHMARQDTANARRYFSQALALNPADSVAYLSRGELAYARRDYARAIADYSQAIRLNAHFLAAYAARGLAYEQQGSLPQAVADYDKCLELADFIEKGQFHRMIGIAKIKQEDPSGCESLRQALKWGDATVDEKELRRIIKEHCR
ncbi:tetratricopeptide repeat protein [Hymenobacter sp. BT635]|uniref:Tetratricopeptide repeat protein n=1 Tax=Hymenobacter nitidus TaxID=2880929 RepID=A0ABS8A9J9_9BACT|nr:tetratricopeptide repeat protein [Hymenobacter nitidus]MCB2377070.1 tetratricopeptide repeat protein [Hymenobacter nitidus]